MIQGMYNESVLDTYICSKEFTKNEQMHQKKCVSSFLFNDSRADQIITQLRKAISRRF